MRKCIFSTNQVTHLPLPLLGGTVELQMTHSIPLNNLLQLQRTSYNSVRGDREITLFVCTCVMLRAIKLCVSSRNLCTK